MDRALSILHCFTDQDPALSLAEIAQRTGLYKSTILRLAASLEDAGFLLRRPDKAYTLGHELLRLGAVYQKSFRLEDSVRPALRRLLAASGESASFFRHSGNMRICLFREDSNHTIRDHVREGALLPLDRGAAGHVLTDYDPAHADVATLRQRAAALPLFSFGERDGDTAAVAVPVYSAPEGAAVLAGALTVSGPRVRFTDTAIERMRPLMLATGRELSEVLGGGTFWRALGLPTGG